jgi:hypothetical protein
MLELRPICEHCAKDLAPHSAEARICSFECTFCANCVEHVLHNVCPNCGGGFEKRPIRPVSNWRGDNDVSHNPPTTTKRHRPVDAVSHAAFAATIKLIPPNRR